MNYMLQIKGFWIQQNAHGLSVDEVGLFFYLVEIANTLKWASTFKRNNSKVMSDLGIRDRRTLDRLRIKLKNAGIIDFKTKNGDANVTYSVCDLSIFCTGYGIGNGTGNGIGSRTGNGIGNGTVNINQTETKPNQAFSASNEAEPPNSEHKNKKEKEKKVPPKKEKTLWEILIDVWFDFHEKLKGERPTFNPESAGALKKIINNLEKRSNKKGYEWNNENATGALTYFLTEATNDKWLKDNFLLKNLNSNFDIIFTNAIGKSKQSDPASMEAELEAAIKRNKSGF